MAKKFNEIYETAKETAYSDETKALVVLGSINKAVGEVSPVLKSNGAAGTAKYNIQRIKRGKVKTVANANANTTSSALAILDSFDAVDWDSVEVLTGVKKSVGLKKSVNEEFDVNSIGDADEIRIASDIEAVAVEREEELVQAIVGANASVEVDDTAAGFQPIQWLDEIDQDIVALQTKSDAFKHGTQLANLVIVMHPRLAQLLARVKGVTFQNEAPIFGTGLTSKFSYNGVPVLTDVTLAKTLTDGAGTPVSLANKVAYTILDGEAIFFQAANDTPIDFTLADTRFVGRTFYDIAGVIDTNRIITKTSKTGFGTAMAKAKA